jgi:hypothetical protein
VDDLAVEDHQRVVDRRELELLFGSEVSVDAALAHLELGGKTADRQPFEAVDGRELRGGLEDVFSGLAAVAAR